MQGDEPAGASVPPAAAAGSPRAAQCKADQSTSTHLDAFYNLDSFLYHTTPVVPSFGPSENPYFHLQDLWEWFDQPYGVEVPILSPPNVAAPEETFLNAYFVPYLSAFEIFGMPPAPSTSPSTPAEPAEPAAPLSFQEAVAAAKEKSQPGPPRRQDLQPPTPRQQLQEQHPPPSVCILQHFETQQPHNRKPLKTLIDDMAASSVDNYDILMTRKSSDLHSDSWFSVAWYPILCHNHLIPYVRGSFLTYHSFRISSNHFESLFPKPKDRKSLARAGEDDRPARFLALDAYLPHKVVRNTWLSSDPSLYADLQARSDDIVANLMKDRAATHPDYEHCMRSNPPSVVG